MSLKHETTIKSLTCRDRTAQGESLHNIQILTEHPLPSHVPREQVIATAQESYHKVKSFKYVHSCAHRKQKHLYINVVLSKLKVK